MSKLDPDTRRKLVDAIHQDGTTREDLQRILEDSKSGRAYRPTFGPEVELAGRQVRTT